MRKYSFCRSVWEKHKPTKESNVDQSPLHKKNILEEIFKWKFSNNFKMSAI